MDRIDIQIEVPAVAWRDMMDETPAEPSADVRQRVMAARDIQRLRFGDAPAVRCNARMPTATVQRLCRLDAAGRALLEGAVRRLGFSARAIERMVKVARTIADLEGKEKIEPVHLAEAIQYRSLDRTAVVQ
jgi:magnesium chelatase family protein